MINRIQALATFGLLAFAAPITASATTVNFDGLSSGTNVDLGATLVADDLRIVNGNCASLDCMALNKNEETKITSTAGTFTIDSFWFQLLGSKSELTVTTSKAGLEVFTISAYGSNDGGHTFSALNNTAFQDIEWITFIDSSSNAGNIRVDDVVLSTVPLPAGALLLLSGIAGIAGLSRRRKASI